MKVAGRATVEEITLIRDYIMMPHMLTMSQKSLDDLSRSTNLFKAQFVMFVQLVMDRITKELAIIKREMRERQIKVFDEEMYDGIIYHSYTCRGYKDRFGIVREALRTEISFRLAEYASSVFNPKT